MNIQKEICDKGLAHAFMEAEKSYNLPSASWRCRKVSGGALV